MAFCSSAQCEISAETRFNVVILTPLKAKLFCRPVVAGGLGVVLAMGWISAIAIIPWFNLVGSRYLGYGSVLLGGVACYLLQYLLLLENSKIGASEMGDFDSRFCLLQYLLTHDVSWV